MEDKHVGDRVAVVLGKEGNVVRFLGFGTYQGTDIAPDMRERVEHIIELEKASEEWPSAIAHFGNVGRAEEEMMKIIKMFLGVPKLVLDDERVFWGHQVWWMTPEEYEREFVGRGFEIVEDGRTIDQIIAMLEPAATA